MKGLESTWLLTVRALRESMRQPWNEVGNVFIPVFFYVVTVGAVGRVAGEAFGVDDYKGFQLPVAILQGAAGVATGSGIAMTTDIQSGYFEKLMLTSAPRYAIVLGRMLADAIKAVALSALVVVLALLIGSGFETGLLGIVALVIGGGLFALAYSGIGVAIALKTGSPQAAQAGFILFFPLLFLAPTFAPTDVFAGWLSTVAHLNPVTYILEGMRSLIIEGWGSPDLWKGMLALAGIGALTGTLTAAALRTRSA